MDLLIAENITKNYANHRALDGVSINVPDGSIFGLLGPNGAGKTTLIRIINQITAPDSGRVILNGEALQPKHTAMIGYLPEERGLYKKMMVGEQAIYLSQLKGLSKAESKKRLKYWFEKFEIDSWWNRKVEELSKGMQQKVQFIVTILHKPRLLIFDEPFSGFDPINTEILKSEILKLKEDGATIIFSTHNMGSVEEICDHIALINNSKKILDGNMLDIKRSHRTDIFEIDYEPFDKSLTDFLPDEFKVLSREDYGLGKRARVKIEDDTQTNKLLNLLMKNSRIIKFQEVIPSMNEIFIKKVKEENNNTK
ncbi:MAG: ABC transporter ATP-binding protein [Bacteroidetes bacterium]|nr:MAG: ABC transporter ATP-binding protein [Bacteroidota bacterium]